MRPYVPCMRREFETCPYFLWRSGVVRPRDIVGNGPDRYGQKRYLCRQCNKTFREPAHRAARVAQFGTYRRAEGLVAVSTYGERVSDAAARLFVSERTLSRWLRTWKKQRVETPKTALRPDIFCELPEDRWYRRVGTVKDAPYVVDGKHLHRYQKAEYGEIRFWLLRESLSTEEDLHGWNDIVRDPYKTKDEREAVIKEARQRLLVACPRLRKQGRE